MNIIRDIRHTYMCTSSDYEGVSYRLSSNYISSIRYLLSYVSVNADVVVWSIICVSYVVVSLMSANVHVLLWNMKKYKEVNVERKIHCHLIKKAGIPQKRQYSRPPRRAWGEREGGG